VIGTGGIRRFLVVPRPDVAFEGDAVPGVKKHLCCAASVTLLAFVFVLFEYNADVADPFPDACHFPRSATNLAKDSCAVIPGNLRLPANISEVYTGLTKFSHIRERALANNLR